MRTLRGLRIVLAIAAICFVPGYIRSLIFPVQDVADSMEENLDWTSLPPRRANSSWISRPRVVRLSEHIFRDDGLLEVNPAGIHPIFELIRRAEEGWREKLNRASTSLPEAVAEYERRYGRDPPKGFDGWWNYVRKHGVQLADEYDQIHKDLEPFWGIEPTDLFAIRAELEAKFDSYTLGKSATSEIGVVNTSFTPGSYDQLIQGSENIIDLLKDVKEFLPPFRAVFSPHDGPNRLSDYFVESAAREAAAEKRYVKREDLPDIDPTGWTSACAPDSPGGNKSLNLNGEPPQKSNQKTFIYDHNLAMNPCLHPRHFWHHGQFLSYEKGPTPEREMVPEFSYCSSNIHHNIRIPTPYGWVEDIHPRSDDPEWDANKVDERLLWRGRNTGIMHSRRTRWQTSHRVGLMRIANDLRGTISILSPLKSETERVGEPVEVRKSRLNPGIMDVAFAGDPIMCDPETCEHLQKIFPWRKTQSAQDAGDYKYVVDVDGNGWSGRFKRLITSNSLVFKATIYPEWYIDRIAPWVHYIPVALDLSDLHDAVVFFRGDAAGAGAHEDLARKIALAGRSWSKTFWRREDMVTYFYRLILEYARLMSEDREAMSYIEDGFAG